MTRETNAWRRSMDAFDAMLRYPCPLAFRRLERRQRAWRWRFSCEQL